MASSAHTQSPSPATLDSYIASHDLVISLVPFIYHGSVLKSAIKGRRHVVTTSYASPAMKELDTAVKEGGIVVLNEVGVDPGVDHLYAIKAIDEFHAKGGKVKEFHSYCGGVPAPECADNPLGFKFSWSPRGSLLSQRNSASFLLNGEEVHIAAEDLMSIAKPYFAVDGYNFVAYPNRTVYRMRVRTRQWHACRQCEELKLNSFKCSKYSLVQTVDRVVSWLGRPEASRELLY